MTDTEELIDESRQGIRTYTQDFSGDIGSKFERVDDHLERAQAALDEDANEETIRELLQDAKDDLRQVVRTYFTGVTPGNFSQYVQRPLDKAVESIN